jgi:signal transduction histidine kinase
MVVALNDGLIVYDADLKILLFSRRAEEILEVEADLVLEQSFSLEKGKDARFKYLAQAMFPSLAPAMVLRSEPGIYPQVVDVTGNEPVKELRVITVKAGDGGFLKIVSDQTEAAAALKTKSEFLTAVAHHLRAPALGASWALDGLAANQFLDEAGREFARIGQGAVRGLLKTIGDLLSVAEIEDGRSAREMRTRLETINLVSFLEEIIKVAEPIAREYQVEIYFDRPREAEISVAVDRVRLGMAVTNLIDNAIKYNLAKGQVTIKAERIENQRLARVSIKDTGVGMTAADLEKLFIKFFRGSNVKKTEVAGSVLGLYLARGIIEQHGGKIWAESVLGRGSTFYLTLPLISNS